MAEKTPQEQAVLDAAARFFQSGTYTDTAELLNAVRRMLPPDEPPVGTVVVDRGGKGDIWQRMDPTDAGWLCADRWIAWADMWRELGPVRVMVFADEVVSRALAQRILDAYRESIITYCDARHGLIDEPASRRCVQPECVADWKLFDGLVMEAIPHG